MLSEIPDRRVQRKIRDRIDALAESPELQGTPLGEELRGFRSVRAVGQRYRIIFKVQQEKVLVVVVALGLRKQGDHGDVYSLARKLVRLGLL